MTNRVYAFSIYTRLDKLKIKIISMYLFTTFLYAFPHCSMKEKAPLMPPSGTPLLRKHAFRSHWLLKCHDAAGEDLHVILNPRLQKEAAWLPWESSPLNWCFFLQLSEAHQLSGHNLSVNCFQSNTLQHHSRISLTADLWKYNQCIVKTT